MSMERLNHVRRAVQALREIDRQTFICHEKEELVAKLLLSESSYLRNAGLVASEFLMMRKNSFNRK